MLPAILAGKVITPQHLTLRQLYTRAWAAYHVLEANNRRPRKNARDGMDFSASIDYQDCLAGKNQTNRTVSRTNMNGLKIGVEHQHWKIHLRFPFSAIVLNDQSKTVIADEPPNYSTRISLGLREDCWEIFLPIGEL
jgi:hypothetical protein